jgi:hypothetical protein
VFVRALFISRTVDISGTNMLGPQVVLVTCLTLQAVQSANILALINLAAPSHYFFNRAVTRSLAARGHKVHIDS